MQSPPIARGALVWWLCFGLLVGDGYFPLLAVGPYFLDVHAAALCRQRAERARDFAPELVLQPGRALRHVAYEEGHAVVSQLHVLAQAAGVALAGAQRHRLATRRLEVLKRQVLVVVVGLEV